MLDTWECLGYNMGIGGEKMKCEDCESYHESVGWDNR